MKADGTSKFKVADNSFSNFQYSHFDGSKPSGKQPAPNLKVTLIKPKYFNLP